MARHPKLTLCILPETLAVCRLAPDFPFPSWALAYAGFLTFSRTAEELSVVCPQDWVPAGIRTEKGWRAFKVEGPLDFSLTGILVTLLQPLAEQRISVFAISTFDTDYILVKEDKLAEAIGVLKKVCHIRG